MYRLLIFTLIIFPACSSCTGKREKNKEPELTIIHEAHLTRGWYSKDPSKLVSEIQSYLKQAQQEFPVHVHEEEVRAMIVPHAGHYFSGLCAATSYQTLLEKDGSKNKRIKRVILIGPSHRKYIAGFALPDYTHYATPLGTIPVDKEAIRHLGKNNQFLTNAGVHDLEHSLEVELPFLQQTIERFELVPLIMGYLPYPHYPDVLKQIKKIVDDETLIVISSDFTHHGDDYQYKPFEKDILDNVRQIDSLVLQSIMNKNINQFNRILRETGSTICGQEPIKLLLAFIEHSDYQSYYPHLSCYYTSAHLEQARKPDNSRITTKHLFTTPRDEQAQRSVSYFGIVFTKDKPIVTRKSDRFTGYEKKGLITMSRDILTNSLKPQPRDQNLLLPVLSNHLFENHGAFVTLNKKEGNLRGCIGKIVTSEPLYKTIVNMTNSAAFNDSRFKPVEAKELSNLIIDISILTPPKQIDSYKDFIIGKHGIILKRINPETRSTQASAVFLPQVAPGQQWNREQTLEALAQKAGIGREGWRHNCLFEVFEGFEIKE